MELDIKGIENLEDEKLLTNIEEIRSFLCTYADNFLSFYSFEDADKIRNLDLNNPYNIYRLINELVCFHEAYYSYENEGYEPHLYILTRSFIVFLIKSNKYYDLLYLYFDITKPKIEDLSFFEEKLDTMNLADAIKVSSEIHTNMSYHFSKLLSEGELHVLIERWRLYRDEFLEKGIVTFLERTSSCTSDEFIELNPLITAVRNNFWMHEKYNYNKIKDYKNGDFENIFIEFLRRMIELTFEFRSEITEAFKDVNTMNSDNLLSFITHTGVYPVAEIKEKHIRNVAKYMNLKIRDISWMFSFDRRKFWEG